MVNCCVKGCGNKQRTYTNTMFHSIPKPVERRSLWLAALGIPATTPVDKINRYRVCDEHFKPEDYEEKMQYATRKMLLHLKGTAVPSIFSTEAEQCSLSMSSLEKHSIEPQCDLQQEMVTVGTGSSESMPLHAQSKATQTPAVTHISLGEGLDFLVQPARMLTVQGSHCSVHTTVWTSQCEPNSNAAIIQGRNGLMSDVVVKIASLLQLFRKCLKCCSDACSVTTERKGSILYVVQQCWSCGNSREWTSQQPLNPAGRPKAEEEPVVTSSEDMAIDMGEEITFNIDEEEEEIQEEERMEEEETDESYELTEQEVEEEDMSEEEEEKPKPTKRKRKDSDDEWAPDTEKVTEASDEEFEEEEEDEEEELIQVAWCCDCGEETSARCLKQKHPQLYCCIKCNQELLCTGDQQTQRTISPEAPSAADQESSCDVSQAAEHACIPDANSNNKQTASRDRFEDSNSISSKEVITSASQHAITSGIQEATSDGVNELGSSCSVRDQGSVGSSDHGGTRNETRWHRPKYAIYFSDLDSLQSHVEQFHGYQRKRELCPDCGKFINTHEGRKPHVCDHKVKLFVCLTCGKRCINEAGLRRHSRVHTEDYVLSCQYCYKKFRFLKDKQEHEETHQGERLKYRCSECPKRFEDCSSRSSHRRTHWEHGRFFCNVCDKGFRDPHHLKRHEVVHTGLKPYSCEVCDMSFNQLGHLKSHMRLHTGERPFKCQDCGQCFNHNVSLKNHIQRKHKPSEVMTVIDQEEQVQSD
ncbi:zinc finger and SCAN domain-containing protein 2-like isoform X3 [Alosa sapidissima]|uniref:zinc finger and SCAN domain-containing protein 2-like isoform X3 n=1 Tax=Alosa sapidissima TaxID=34773 RepID=UPI001C083773|nr:zinc finger and SCAN domain-containing protein 2-like isoform X3 [Alosa sapidissima]